MSQNISHTADVVICGAGIAGVAAAYYLRQQGVESVVLVDQEAPLSRTSSRSAECYRDWFGDRCMLEFMSHSITLLEELAAKSGNRFHMNRRGYLHVSFRKYGPDKHLQNYREKRAAGIKGELRIHKSLATYKLQEPSLNDDAPGTDWLLGDAAATAYPYLGTNVTSILHARRCGWLSAQQMGMYMLEQAGASFVRARVTSFTLDRQGISEVRLSQDSSTTSISTRHFINAAGPWAGEIAKLLGQELPLKNILHEKVVFNDYEGILPRDAPMIICLDKFPVEIRGDIGKRELIQRKRASGVYLRPEGRGQSVLAGWAYDEKEIKEPIWPPDPHYHEAFREVVLNAVVRVVKGFSIYADHIQKLGSKFWGSNPHDGGYYTETRDNGYIVLIGPLEVPGTYTISGLSGIGVMSSCAAGKLAALWATEAKCPDYAHDLTPEYWQLMKGQRSVLSVKSGKY